MEYQIYLDNILYTFDKIGKLLNFIKSNPNKVYYKIVDNEKIKINVKLVMNTEFICHRVNKIEELKKIDKIFGVEIDIRDDLLTNKLILAHDPFVYGDSFEEYLKLYSNQTLILNIKSERVELKCLELLNKYNISKYFFLDSSFPLIYLLNTKYQNNKIASRYSEFELIELSENIKDMIEWIWIDCFTKLPLDKNIMERIKRINKKICIVSPELQSQKEKIKLYRRQLLDNDIIPDAICCKEYNIYEWI
jgi:hypothetical protein